MARPSTYTDDVPAKVLGFMYEGMSIEEVCYELEICKQTFYNWCEKYPELLDAKKRGTDFSCGWWMRQGRTNMNNQKFNSTLWYMNMKNRFGWADRQKTDITSDGKPIINLVDGTGG